jgi:putative sugar O-methyltransferase
MKEDNEIFTAINASVKSLCSYEKSIERKEFGDWESRFVKEMNKLIDDNLNVRPEHLINFRGRQLFVADRPSVSFKGFYSSSPAYYGFKRFLNLFLGTQRGGIREALDAYDVIEREGFLDLLKKYPTPDIGNPLKIEHNGYKFTNRYIRHIYLLGMFNRHLKDRLPSSAVVMDIGSSYGIFSSVIKQEHPGTHHVLVDLSGQLILAHYYLKKLFPNAKIAGFKEVVEAKRIDKAWIQQYDFVLVPTSLFSKLTAGSVDLATNFISLAEMSRHWFSTYVDSDVFKTASYLFTVNRYDAHPTYANDITVLDYPLKEYEKIYMRTCPFLHFYYVSKWYVAYRQVNYPSQFFQFVGKRLLTQGGK